MLDVTPATILIAGAVTPRRDQMVAILERTGYRVELATSVAETERRLGNPGIDLVLVQPELPDKPRASWIPRATATPETPGVVLVCSQQAASVAFRRMGAKRLHMVRESVATALLPWVVQQALSLRETRHVPIPGYLYGDLPVAGLTHSHF